MKESKYNSMNPDLLADSNLYLLPQNKDRPSELDSLFNNSEYWNDASSLDLLSQNSEGSE